MFNAIFPQDNVPPTTTPGSAGQVLKDIASNGANFGPWSPLIGILSIIAGALFALMFIGGVVQVLKGGLRFSWAGDNTAHSAAARKSISTGVVVMIAVGAIGAIMATIAAFIALF
jgi:hypothetical protein